MEMAVAHALGDRVSRLDLHVLGHVRELLGIDAYHAVVDRLRELGGDWPDVYPGEWPRPIARATVPTLPKPRAPWYWRAFAWAFRGRS